MRKQKKNFVNSNDNETYYDLFEDWELIEASILKQYGIRIRQQLDMSWNEFCTLLNGLMYNTPLGQVVAIRSEKNKDVIKNFSPQQKRIYNEWKKRTIKRNNKKSIGDINKLEELIKRYFG